MPVVTRTISVLAVLSALYACDNESAKEQPLDTLEQKASYSFGVDIATTLHAQGIDLDYRALSKGIADVYTGTALALGDEERLQAKTSFREQLQEAMAQQQNSVAETNLAAGKAFLEENAKQPGVVTTESGLQYKIITSGDGKQPTESDTVTTHYRGTLIDGREFDSSYKRNQPATFPVKGVIKGCTEALQLMHVGDKWQLFIPAELAYGTTQRGELIQPNSALIFEVELLGIKE